jgi:hypothetical protein
VQDLPEVWTPSRPVDPDPVDLLSTEEDVVAAIQQDLDDEPVHDRNLEGRRSDRMAVDDTAAGCCSSG